MQLDPRFYALVVSAISAFSLYGCYGASPPITSAECLVIGVEDEPERLEKFDYGRELIPLFDEFAEQHAFDGGAESSGGAVWYEKDGVGFSLSLGMGIGKAGAAYYVEDAEICIGCNEFRRFIIEVVAEDYEVTECYQPSKLYNPSL